MCNRIFLLFFFIRLFSSDVQAQFTDRYWAFGDSAGIDFKNLSNPQPANSILRVRGTCASICDSAGDLLFYSGSPNWMEWLNPFGPVKFGTVVNKNHSTMDNGDTLIGVLWYQEMAIVPDPANSNRFIYLQGVTHHGFYYTVVDLSYNGGLGKVVRRMSNFEMTRLTDCAAVVKQVMEGLVVLIRSWKMPNQDITAYLIDPRVLLQCQPNILVQCDLAGLSIKVQSTG
ncbi:MAG: hypothetical protein IPM91_09880 [Bacteroidetes bacterium]|nr:hypothetical protein [Bacteroidota bacterium]